MIGVVLLVTLVGVVGLLAGVALGWWLRRTNDWCTHCGDQLTCEACGSRAAWPRPSVTSDVG
jgi:hypothetical protein